MSLLCRDTQLNISPTYLKPGFAFGGSCLPKDLRAMLYLGKSNDVDLPVMLGVQQTNAVHIQHATDMVMSAGTRKVGMVGLSFKPGTDDLRESPLVELAEKLIGKGYDLRIHDPAVNLARLIGANKNYIRDTIPHIDSVLTDDIETVLEHAEVLVVGQSNEDLQRQLQARGRLAPKVVDLVGLDSARGACGDYAGLCW
jgi:GDP-mannose 6-dehydrogenase